LLWGEVPARLVRGEPSQFLLDEVFCSARLPQAAAQVGLCDSLQIVDVPEGNAGQVANRRFDITWDRHVDQHKPAVSAVLQRPWIF
jgi:hypothetical protein